MSGTQGSKIGLPSSSMHVQKAQYVGRIPTSSAGPPSHQPVLAQYAAHSVIEQRDAQAVMDSSVNSGPAGPSSFARN